MPSTYTFPNPLYISFTILCNRHWKILAKYVVVECIEFLIFHFRILGHDLIGAYNIVQARK